jgi:hypothetical protein
MEIKQKANVGKVDNPELNLQQDLMSALDQLSQMVCAMAGECGDEVKGMVDKLGQAALGKDESKGFIEGLTRKHAGVLEMKRKFNADPA